MRLTTIREGGVAEAPPGDSSCAREGEWPDARMHAHTRARTRVYGCQPSAPENYGFAIITLKTARPQATRQIGCPQFL